jgi:hypothetical protein
MTTIYPLFFMSGDGVIKSGTQKGNAMSEDDMKAELERLPKRLLRREVLRACV